MTAAMTAASQASLTCVAAHPTLDRLLHIWAGVPSNRRPQPRENSVSPAVRLGEGCKLIEGCSRAEPGAAGGAGHGMHHAKDRATRRHPAAGMPCSTTAEQPTRERNSLPGNSALEAGKKKVTCPRVWPGVS